MIARVRVVRCGVKTTAKHARCVRVSRKSRHARCPLVIMVNATDGEDSKDRRMAGLREGHQGASGGRTREEWTGLNTRRQHAMHPEGRAESRRSNTCTAVTTEGIADVLRQEAVQCYHSAARQSCASERQGTRWCEAEAAHPRLAPTAHNSDQPVVVFHCVAPSTPQPS